jgi:hypothetical protein
MPTGPHNEHCVETRSCNNSKKKLECGQLPPYFENLFLSIATNYNYENIMADTEVKMAFTEAYTRPPRPQPLIKKSGQMTKDQLDHFFKEGYVILDDFVNTNLLESIKIELEKQVDDCAEKLFKAGKIKDKYQNKDFFHRMIYLNEEFPGK